jgi:hypothetical protein
MLLLAGHPRTGMMSATVEITIVTTTIQMNTFTHLFLFAMVRVLGDRGRLADRPSTAEYPDRNALVDVDRGLVDPAAASPEDQAEHQQSQPIPGVWVIAVLEPGARREPAGAHAGMELPEDPSFDRASESPHVVW